ncbi:50S ribosomal protein L4 [bacterium]|nr:50S ribosomal protein L4 [bacterium]
MVTANVVDSKLNTVAEVTLSPAIFEIEPHGPIVHDIVRAQLAARRRGTAKTKTRGEVNASGSKPYRQKGTGRARRGTNRSPLIEGGGTVFGPMPRSYALNIPKKIKKLGIVSALAQKFKQGDFIIINELMVESGKTKDFVALWQSIVQGQQVKTLFVIPAKNESLWRSSRNVNCVKLTLPDKLNVYDLLYYPKLVITQSALERVQEVYS